MQQEKTDIKKKMTKKKIKDIYLKKKKKGKL